MKNRNRRSQQRVTPPAELVVDPSVETKGSATKKVSTRSPSSRRSDLKVPAAVASEEAETGGVKKLPGRNQGYISDERMKTIQEEFPFFPPCKDLDAPRREALLWLPETINRFALRYIIKDEEDLPMLSVVLNICGFAFTLNTLLFLYPSHALGVFVVAADLILFLGRYILTLHFMAHKCIFKPHLSFLDGLMTTLVAPFFGMPIGMYRAHHVVMHHVENNIFPWDLSSTEPYQRDNFLHFIHYALKYWTCLVLLPIYALRRKRYELAAQASIGCLIWIGTMYFFLAGPGNNPLFGLYGFVIPGLITGTAMMFGNWSQHIFVDPKLATMRNEAKSYRYNCALTYQCMNHGDNQMTWNDGYHITHHLQSRCAWYNLPIHFLQNLEKYRDADAIVFNEVNVFEVGFSVFTGNYDRLAKHYVNLGKTEKSKEEIVKRLKSLLVPFT